MKIRNSIFIFLAASTILASYVALADYPADSGYEVIPKKKKGVTSNDGVQSIREEAVKPEEVYKHGVQEISVIATDTGFHPARIYVRRNIPVHLFLTSASPSKLCFVMDDFQIRKGVMIQQVEQVNFLPTKVGEYKFYCPVSEISGSVVVRD
jgi:heme/copper-type cytochrome/quinol oxidase subunit 2